jgi:cell wall-associated NlpC family hydrolase
VPHTPLKDMRPADDSEHVEAAALPEAPARPRKRLQRRALIAAAAGACAIAAAGVALFSSGGGATERSVTAAARPAAATTSVPTQDATPSLPPLKSHPKVVRAVGPGQAIPDGVTAGSSGGSGVGSQPPSDAQVRNELADFRQHLQGVGTARGAAAGVRPDGTAVVPLDAPDVVAQVVAAGNEIATKPYKWGGGHGAWRDSGYDCSGSVSFALAGAGLLQGPLTSGLLMKWGDPGRGRWITILANNGHTFMVVAGLRFDTSGAQGGTRWQPVNGRSYAGFVARHPPGL